MARRSRLSAYALSMKGQAEKPASSVREKLSRMKQKADAENATHKKKED